MAYTFEVRQIEALASPDGWEYNLVWGIGTFKTSASDVRRALTAYMRRELGITFQRGTIRIEDDGDYITIFDRFTGEPLFDAICLR